MQTPSLLCARALKCGLLNMSLLLVCLPGRCLSAPENEAAQSLWQIGTFDQSSFEFAAANTTKPVRFQVGSSDPKKDWPGKQRTGDPYVVAFALGYVTGSYSLRINLLIEEPRIPALLIDVNGHAGVFYLHPKLSYSRSGFTYAFDPHEAESEISVEVPRAFLKQGANILTLTCVDQPMTPKGELELGGISYDALSFEHHVNGAGTNQPADISVEPTIFYHQSPTGPTEVVDGYVRLHGSEQPGNVELQVGGKHYTAQLKGGEFGEERVSWDVAEWKGIMPGTVRLAGSGARPIKVELAAQRKWTVFVVPHTHLDVGFTDYQGKVAETQSRVLSQAGTLIQQHPDFRFSMDGSWNLQQLLETRPPIKQQEIIDLIRSGKMAMPAQYCNLLTGYASLETLYRSLYDSKRIALQYGLPLEYANITDVPTYSGSYPSILASSGIKYWVAASNNDRAPIFSYDHWNEKSPFWWQGPDGKKILFWYSRHYQQVQALFGLTPQLTAVRESLPVYLQAYSQPGYKPDVAMLYGTQVENTDLVAETATFATDWNSQYTFPKLTYATFPDFFHYLEAHGAVDLPVVKSEGSGYWEDGVGSDAYFAAEDRQNQNRALSAEILSSVTHSVDPNLNPPVGAFTDIWHNIILFAEHTWLSYNAVSQPAHQESIKQIRVKDDRAERASLQIEDVTNRALSQLADNIHIPADTLVVFNSLNWQRDALVEIDLFEKARVVDMTSKQDVPVEILANKQNFLRLRFHAKDLPAVGYKCFQVVKGTDNTKLDDRVSDTTVENQFYRVRVDTVAGALTSIYDKQLRREIVDSHSPYKFGQYLYVTGGDGNTQIINPFPALPPAELTIHAAAQGRYLGAEHLPWGESIRMISSAPHTPAIESEILLFNSQKRIEFRFQVRKDYTASKEAVYFAFPVAVAHPRFSYASQQGWVDPSRDIMKGGSLEWFNVQQWMAVQDDGLAVGIVPLDASLASFGDINRGHWPGGFRPKSGTIFSYVMNNYWHTNYRAGQGGDFTFRYVVTSAEQRNGGALTKLGLEAMRPLEVNHVVSQDKVGNPPRPLPSEGQGFLETDGGNIAIVTWKRAENGNGDILRIAELSGKPAEALLRFKRVHLESAHLCTGLEADRQELPVADHELRVQLGPLEVATLRVVGK